MTVLKVEALTVKLHAQTVINNISFSINNKEQWAIVGPSGSGKTTLLKALANKILYTGAITFPEGSKQKIVLVEQQHHFKNLSNTNNFYYQQRFNSSDSEDAISVEEDLQKVVAKHEISENKFAELILFDLKKLYKEPLIQLSNGENKRLQIVKALLLQPSILLLDNPFTGLDVNSRHTLENVLTQIIQKGIHIILATSPSHVPAFITNVLSLPQNISEATSANYLRINQPSSHNHFNPQLLQELTENKTQATFEYAVKMNDVHVKYHDKEILNNINWEVKNGERWSLSGANGSGKSTLLSLINADNPQAYANDIYLFDRKRGTGETIWDIKKKIGFVSPEVHLYFEKGIICSHVVASGLFDTIGLFRKLTPQQSALVLQWMELLQIDHLKNKFLFQLSNSEQRLVLLARALVKNPPLLILDEPCQGLDDEQVQLFKNLIDEICVVGNKTLIYVSHYVEEIPACVTKFIRLDKGKIVS